MALIAVEQFDRRLPRLQKAAKELRDQAPRGGWLRAIRTALGMSEQTFAQQLRIKRASLQELERHERDGSITLASLRRAAEALDGDIVYAIVPRRKLREAIAARARKIARQQVLAGARSMALEQQALSKVQLERQVDELARELEQRPRELWR